MRLECSLQLAENYSCVWEGLLGLLCVADNMKHLTVDLKMRSVATVERKNTLCESATLELELSISPVSVASSHDARNICTEEPPIEDAANLVYEMFPLAAPKLD